MSQQQVKQANLKNKLLRLFDSVELNKLKNDTKIHIITGPIIGKVTHVSISILLELNQNVSNLECTLINTSDAKWPSYKAILEFIKCRPRVYTFANLSPTTSYRFVVTDSRISDDERIKNEARITTFAEKPTKFNVIVVSNNEVKNVKDWSNHEENMWSHLYERFETEKPYDCIVHLGNQVNLKVCIDHLLKNPKILVALKKEDVYEHIKELFRIVYRTNWSKKYIKQVMGMTQNLMIWGSGDSLVYCQDSVLSSLERPCDASVGLKERLQSRIFTEPIKEKENDNNNNNNGSTIDPLTKSNIIENCMNEIKKLTGVEVNLYKASHEVYCEYQRQLWDTDDQINITKPREYHSHQWGKYGIFMFDMKGNRLKNYQESPTNSASLLGNTQAKALKDFLNSPGLEIPIICSEHPFVDKIVNTENNKDISDNNITTEAIIIENTDKLSDNCKHVSIWPSHERNMYTIYRFFEKWQTVNKIGKKIVLLAGTSSPEKFGAKIVISTPLVKSDDNKKEHGKHKQMVQMSCGPIADKIIGNRPTSTSEMKYRRWKIKHTEVPKANYGKINMSIHDGRNIIVAEIITSKVKNKKNNNEDELATPLPPVTQKTANYQTQLLNISKLKDIVSVELEPNQKALDLNELAFETTENYAELDNFDETVLPKLLDQKQSKLSTEDSDDIINNIKLKSAVFNFNKNSKDANNDMADTEIMTVTKPPVLISTVSSISLNHKTENYDNNHESKYVNKEKEKEKEKDNNNEKDKNKEKNKQKMIDYAINNPVDTYDKEYQEILKLLSDEITDTRQRQSTSTNDSEKNDSEESDDKVRKATRKITTKKVVKKQKNNKEKDKIIIPNTVESPETQQTQVDKSDTDMESSIQNVKRHKDESFNDEDLNKAIEEAIQRIGTSGLMSATRTEEKELNDPQLKAKRKYKIVQT